MSRENVEIVRQALEANRSDDPRHESRRSSRSGTGAASTRPSSPRWNPIHTAAMTASAATSATWPNAGRSGEAMWKMSSK